MSDDEEVQALVVDNGSGARANHHNPPIFCAPAPVFCLLRGSISGEDIFFYTFSNKTYNFILNVIDKFSDYSMLLKCLKNWKWKSLKKKVFCIYVFLPNLNDKLNLIIKQEGVLDWRNLLEFN